MTQIKNNINTYADITAYNADLNKDYPNVSYLINEDEVKYSNPVVYATFNVSSSSTKVIVTYNPAAFAKIELNGQEIELVDTYKYDFGARGTYTLKYTLASETAIPNRTWGWCYELISMTDIPKTITSIGESAFLGCKFTSFTIPSGVTSIGGSAFNSSRLTSITIPNSVTSIGESAFGSCNTLTNVTIGSGVRSIGSGAFEYCGDTTNKCTFTILATTPPTLATSYNVFTIGRTEAIYVPSESVNAYKTATNWSSYASIIQAIPTT